MIALNCSGSGSGRTGGQAGAGGSGSGGEIAGTGGVADQGNGSPDAAIDPGAIDTSGTWYGYVERCVGFVTLRLTATFVEGNCSFTYAGLDDTADAGLMLFEGSCHAVPGGWAFTVARITVDNGSGPATVQAGDANYADVRGSFWGENDLKQFALSASPSGGMQLGFQSRKVAVSVDVQHTANDALYAQRRGTYPEINYLGLGFHNNPQNPGLTLDVMGNKFAGSVTSATATLRGPTGEEHPAIALSLDNGEYKGSHAMGPYPAEGIWFISAATVTTDRGSVTQLTRSSPYEPYFQTIHSSAGSDVTGTLNPDWYHILGQDYVPPQTATAWIYIEGFHNGSSVSRVDPAFYAYRASDTSRWFAADDDNGKEELMPGLKLPVASGERLYLQVKDIYRGGGAYSIRATATGFGATTTQTITVDSFEPDDDAASAKPLPLETFQPHLFAPAGESDWVTIDVP